jgi:hypothetical protein
VQEILLEVGDLLRNVPTQFAFVDDVENVDPLPDIPRFAKTKGIVDPDWFVKGRVSVWISLAGLTRGFADGRGPEGTVLGPMYGVMIAVYALPEKITARVHSCRADVFNVEDNVSIRKKMGAMNDPLVGVSSSLRGIGEDLVSVNFPLVDQLSLCINESESL